jgi:hypothetical protein
MSTLASVTTTKTPKQEEKTRFRVHGEKTVKRYKWKQRAEVDVKIVGSVSIKNIFEMECSETGVGVMELCDGHFSETLTHPEAMQMILNMLTIVNKCDHGIDLKKFFAEL